MAIKKAQDTTPFNTEKIEGICIPYTGYKGSDGLLYDSKARAALSTLEATFDRWYSTRSKDRVTYKNDCGEETELEAKDVRRWLNANWAEITAYLGKYASLQEELKNAQK
jgi:hypothetical protein